MERRLCSKLGVALIIVGSVFILTAAAALAASNAELEPSGSVTLGNGLNRVSLSVTGMISPTQPISGANMVASYIALAFGVPVSDVVTLHSDGFGYGVIAMAHFLALDSGLSVQDILDMKESGMGMGEIAKYLGLPPGNSGRNLGLVVSSRGTATTTVSIGAQRLANRLGVAPEEIAALLDQGATYGTIAAAYKTASQFSGVTPEELVNRRLAGEKWGQIKRELRTSAAAISAVDEPAQGNPHRGGNQGNQGNQGRGKPQNQENRGCGQERGQGHNKDRSHVGGNKH